MSNRSPINFKKYRTPRIRHHVSPNLYYRFEDLRELPLHYPPAIKELDWSRYFKNGADPDILDIGSGMGKFLMEFAEQHNEKNILGLEVRKIAAQWVEKILREEKIPNASCLWYSAVNKFPFIKDNSIEKIYFLFPDPWIKRRHFKRRIITASMLSEFERVLKPEGEILIKTDVQELDKYHRTTICGHGRFKIIEPAEGEKNIISNREEFCMEKKIPFYILKIRRKRMT